MLISKDSPRAPSQAPKDRNINLNNIKFLITKIVNMVTNISSNLKSSTIKCFCREKFKKQQKIIKYILVSNIVIIV